MTRSAEFGRFSSVVMVSLTHAGLLCPPTLDLPTDSGPERTSDRRGFCRSSLHRAVDTWGCGLGLTPPQWLIQLAATAARPPPATKRARQCGLPLVPVDGARRP